MCDRCESTKSFLSGALIGAAVGAAMGILFAPESGENTRRKIKSESLKLRDKGEDIIDDIKDKMAEVEDGIVELKDRAEPAIKETIEKLEEKGRDLKEDINDTAKTLKSRYFKGLK